MAMVSMDECKYTNVHNSFRSAAYHSPNQPAIHALAYRTMGHRNAYQHFESLVWPSSHIIIVPIYNP
jgi:hypothetical protein